MTKVPGKKNNGEWSGVIRPNWIKNEWQKNTHEKKFRKHGKLYYAAIMELVYHKIMKGAAIKATDDGKNKVSVEYLRQAAPHVISYVHGKPSDAALQFSKEEPLPLPPGKKAVKKAVKKPKKKSKVTKVTKKAAPIIFYGKKAGKTTKKSVTFQQPETGTHNNVKEPEQNARYKLTFLQQARKEANQVKEEGKENIEEKVVVQKK